MDNYFKPWQRRIGVVTLTLAQLFAVLWVRSHIINEVFTFRSGNWLYGVASFNGKIAFWTFLAFGAYVPFYQQYSPPDYVAEETNSIPYWFIVAVLALLSAWLLLSKYRQPQIAEPAAPIRKLAASNMSDYFKPWRRRIGVVTLVLAFSLTACWIRSLTLSDGFKFVSGQRLNLIFSQHGCIEWTTRSYAGYDRNKPFTVKELRDKFKWMSLDIKTSALISSWASIETENHWQCLGFTCGMQKGPFPPPKTPYVSRVEFWSVSYWSLVIPLTLLSAWLLLSKPRSANRLR